MELIAERRRGCVYLTLNRPEKRNALNSGLIESLGSALHEYAREDDVRVIVLRGAGTVFSSGADLAELEEMQNASREENLRSSRALSGLFQRLLQHPKPVIACVNGPAIGGGCGLALACDLVFASRAARFGFAEVRLGFVPAIVAGLVVRRAGYTAARDLLLSGRLVDADEAYLLGLATRVSESDDLADEVDRQAASIARETSATAVTTTKRLLVSLDGLSLLDGLEYGALANADARQSDDYRAGVSAFLKKEPFPWQRAFDEFDDIRP